MTYISTQDHQPEDLLFLRSYYSSSLCLTPGRILTYPGYIEGSHRRQKLLCSLMVKQSSLCFAIIILNLHSHKWIHYLITMHPVNHCVDKEEEC